MTAAKDNNLDDFAQMIYDDLNDISTDDEEDACNCKLDNIQKDICIIREDMDEIMDSIKKILDFLLE
jgi:hypothetical protein